MAETIADVCAGCDGDLLPVEDTRLCTDCLEVFCSDICLREHRQSITPRDCQLFRARLDGVPQQLADELTIPLKYIQRILGENSVFDNIWDALVLERAKSIRRG